MLNSNLGVFYDMVYILTKHFNEPIQTKWVNLKNVPDVIRLFFYKNDNGTSFMQQVLEDSLEELLNDESLQVIQNKIIDCPNTVNLITDFYFSDEAAKFSLNNYEFICAVNKQIAKSKYPAEVKISLYSFFIEPVKIIHELMKTLLDLYSQISQMYKNHISTISKIQQETNDEELFKKLNIHKGTTESIVLAVCLLDSECIKVISSNNTTILFLGEEYTKNFELSGDLALKDFGYALTEMNRLKILNMMNASGEITIKDIEQELKLSGTNAYYHLSLLIKAGMVTTRYKGRTVFYSINKVYFKTLCLKLSKYY